MTAATGCYILTNRRRVALDKPVPLENEFWAVNCAISDVKADGEPGDAADCRRAAGLAPVARVVSPGGEPAVPGQQCRGRHRKDPGPAPPRDEPCERGEPGPVGWLVPDPARVPAQH